MEKINGNYKIKIEKLDDDLDGVAFSGGKKYVVARTLPGEVVEAAENRVSGNAVVCRVKSIIEPSASRVAAPCKYYEKCGGCNMLHTSYDNQLAIKTALVKRKFASLGFTDISPCVGFNVSNYRNKVHICFGYDEKNITAGFFDEDTHQVVDVPDCLCHGEWYHTLCKTLKKWAAENRVLVYNPKSRKGLLRFAVARCIDNRLMLTLVLTAFKPLNFAALYEKLKGEFAEVSLYVNENGEFTNEVFSGKFTHIAGGKTLCGKINGINFSLSPDSFFQVNCNVAETIYANVLDTVKKSGADKVVDLFSGIGVTSAMFAKEGVAVESVEIVKSAVDNAKSIAVKNGVEDNITFHTGDCLKELAKIQTSGHTAVFVDPPRRGLGEDVAKIIAANNPQTVIYLSCNLKSLISDLQILTAAGYKISSVTPYDMFPATTHVETLICLSKKS